MIVIADTSALLAAHDAHEPEHERCREAIADADLLVLSTLVLAEFDYLVARQLGEPFAIAACDEIARRVAEGSYQIPEVNPDVITSAGLVRVQYRSLAIGLTDAVNVMLAAHYRTDAVLTLDRRHFRTVRPLEHFGAFRLLPDDA